MQVLMQVSGLALMPELVPVPVQLGARKRVEMQQTFGLAQVGLI
jgi:hypothetical protein